VELSKKHSYAGGALKDKGAITFDFKKSKGGGKSESYLEATSPLSCCIDGSGSKYANRFCACDTSRGLEASCHCPNL